MRRNSQCLANKPHKTRQRKKPSCQMRGQAPRAEPLHNALLSFTTYTEQRKGGLGEGAHAGLALLFPLFQSAGRPGGVVRGEWTLAGAAKLCKLQLALKTPRRLQHTPFIYEFLTS